MTPTCDFDPGMYLLIGPNVGPLQYYSHIPIIAFALVLAGFILYAHWKGLPNRILAGSIVIYALWVFFDSIIWASNRSDVIMFMWSLQVLIEPLVYMGCLYLLYVLTAGKDAPFKAKLIAALLYLPLVGAAPTAYNLSGFDITACLANEGPMALYYAYAIEIVFVFWMLAYASRAFNRAPASGDARMKVFYLTAALVLLLVSFSWGNIIGSLTGDWQLAQYGLFGMPVFTAFLVYSIVRYHAFNIRIVGAVALVFGLVAATFSLLFVQQVEVFRDVAAVTFLLSLIFGVMLIRSVRREVEQRMRIEQLAKDLQHSNEQQIILIHFITHQIKGFVTKSRNIFSMLLEGDFGQVPDTMRPMLEEGLRSDTKGVNTIQEILNAANIKSGKVTYTKTPIDVRELTEGLMQDLRAAADAKGLAIQLTAAEGDYTIQGDRMQLTNAIKNLIDNSIKYTPKGKVDIGLTREADKVRLVIKDTGVGITSEDMRLLFTEGGHGKESQKVNVESTGFGLYIVKNIIEAHHGKVWAESEGAGKGSRFIVELPVS